MLEFVILISLFFVTVAAFYFMRKPQAAQIQACAAADLQETREEKVVPHWLTAARIPKFLSNMRDPPSLDALLKTFEGKIAYEIYAFLVQGRMPTDHIFYYKNTQLRFRYQRVSHEIIYECFCQAERNGKYFTIADFDVDCLRFSELK